MAKIKFFHTKTGIKMVNNIAYIVNTLLCKSIRFKSYGYDNLKKLHEDKEGGLLFLWHETIMIPIFFCRNLDINTLVSLSKDGDIQNYILEKYGYDTVRGSTKRNGVQALMQMIRGLKEKKIYAVTPDGPLGPVNKCQPGSAAMIKKTGAPFVSIGVALDKKYVFEKAWDKHQIPKPFTKCVICFSEIVRLDSNLPDEEISLIIENSLNQITDKAHKILSGEINE